LPARRKLRVAYATDALVLRHPLLDLHGEQVIIKLGLQLLEAPPKLDHDLRIEGEPVPVVTLPVYSDSSADKIEVSPRAADHL
jgi:hypothetical protein